MFVQSPDTIADSTACCLVHQCLYFFVQGPEVPVYMGREKRMWKLFSYQNLSLIFIFANSKFERKDKGERERDSEIPETYEYYES